MCNISHYTLVQHAWENISKTERNLLPPTNKMNVDFVVEEIMCLVRRDMKYKDKVWDYSFREFDIRIMPNDVMPDFNAIPFHHETEHFSYQFDNDKLIILNIKNSNTKLRGAVMSSLREFVDKHNSDLSEKERIDQIAQEIATRASSDMKSSLGEWELSISNTLFSLHTTTPIENVIPLDYETKYYTYKITGDGRIYISVKDKNSTLRRRLYMVIGNLLGTNV